MTVIDTSIVIERVKRNNEIRENITEVTVAAHQLWITKNSTGEFWLL